MVANIAHRGTSRNYPENTLLAFLKALEIGVDEIELDLGFTRDERVVIMHDSTVDRTTQVRSQIETFNEIKGLDAGSWFGQQFRGESVPAWEEVLDLVQGKVKLNVHLKEIIDPSGNYKRSVAKGLHDFRMVEASVLLCDEESVEHFVEIDPAIKCQIGRGHRTAEEYIQLLWRWGFNHFNPGEISQRRILSSERIKQV